jgi:hypothetical protein
MNPSTKSITDRLPNKPIIGPGDIAAAFGMPDASRVIDAIRRGKILAATIGRKFYISRDEAARYIESTEYVADEV